MTDDRQVFLSTLPAGRRERQLALVFVLVSVGIFLAAAPFAKTPLPPVPPFLPIYQSALVINDLITAVLFLGQFAILRSRALLVLACGYLFSACMAVSHALSFPGLFSPTGLLGAGPQTTAWLYFFWHGGFPLFIIAYALLKNEGQEPGQTGGQARSSVRWAVLSGVAAALAFAGGLTLLTTAGHDVLPAIMRGDTDAQQKIIVASATWVVILAALVVLWHRRPHLALDLWLVVVMWVWVFDVALAGVLNHGRYDLGWYAGRIYGLVAGSVVLVVLLIENGRLYARLAEAHASERQERQLVQEKTTQLVNVNKELDVSMAALRESEESLSTTLHSIGDAVLATDTQGRITRMNPVAERLTGWPFPEAQGQPVDQVFHIVHEQTRASAVVPVATVLATGKLQGLANHTVLIARDGREWPVADSAAPIYDASGRVSGVVLVFRDVSAERLAERTIREQNELLEQRVRERTAQLRESEKRFRALIQSAPDGISLLGVDGKLFYASPSTQRILGYAPETVIGTDPKDYTYPDDLDPFLILLNDLMQKPGSSFTTQYRFRHQDGSWRWLESTVSNLLAEPWVNAVVFNYRDITERKRAEQEIHQLNASLERRVAERTRQLEEANSAKSDFLANMSHELRTPLNSIIGCSEMLKDGILGELDKKQSDFVSDIFGAGTHLLSLINDILDLSKVEAGMLQLEADAVDVAALLKASTLIVREKATAHRIRLDTLLDPTLGTMLGDERKLKQIVYNLLSNAVKFSPEGGAVTLSAHRCARAEVTLDETQPRRLIALPPGADGEFLAITVEDSGVGIAEEHLPKLFEPFTQVDSSAARRHAGTGLGLSLVRRFAELHGGTVGVASRLGAGSCFCVWLPWRATAPAELRRALPKRAED